MNYERAVAAYTPPEGFEWKPVVIDGLNIIGPPGEDVVPGILFMAILTFLKKCGLDAAQTFVVLPRRVWDSHHETDPDLRMLRRLGCLVESPSWVARGSVQALRTDTLSPTVFYEDSDPWKVNDDLVGIHTALALGAVLISSDHFRDAGRYLEDAQLDRLKKLLPEIRVSCEMKVCPDTGLVFPMLKGSKAVSCILFRPKE